MNNKLISRGIKRAYLELEGKNFNVVHYRQNQGRYRKMIDAVLPLSKSVKILDIGAGFCYLTKFFKIYDYEVYAIDFFYGDLPKTRCEQSGIPFYSLNVEQDELPFEDGFFAVIILGEVVEHFTYSPLIPLSKIQKALKKDGTFILTSPNFFRIFEMLKKFTGHNRFKNRLSAYPEKPVWYKGRKFYYRHNRLYSRKELKQIMEQSGFNVVSSGFVNEGISLKGNPIKIFLKSVFLPFTIAIPQLRDVIWIQAKKNN